MNNFLTESIIFLVLVGLSLILILAFKTNKRDKEIIARQSDIVKNLQQVNYPSEYEGLKQSFIDEIKSIYTHQNPEIEPSIGYVLVLSARHSYNKESVLSSPQNANAFDKNDGFDRMNLGIDVARKTTALKLGKDLNFLTLDDIEAHGPTIIYNGEKESNSSLVNALNSGIIKNYPSRKFIIIDLDQNKAHTQGQFENLQQQEKLGSISLKNKTIAIVTHAYHFPRVGRTIGLDEGFNYLPNSVMIAYLVDREFNAPGVGIELELEMLKLPLYVEKKFILPNISSHIIYNH